MIGSLVSRAALLASVVIMSSASSPMLPSTTTPGAGAVARFTACTAGAKKGDLVILMDESGSLSLGPDASDPADSRIKAGHKALQRLADFARRTSSDLQVSIVGFGTEYHDYGGRWIGLRPETLSTATAAMDAFTDRDREQGTDYWLGLDGARKTLAAHAAGDATRCKALVFFSDGALDISKSPNESDFRPTIRPYAPGNPLDTDAQRKDATAKAAESLCRPGGLADQLRAENIVMLGIGLSPSGDAGSFDLMKGVVTGTRAAGGCGTNVTPVPGDFVLASNIDDLLLAFLQVTDKGTVQTAEICQGTIGSACAHRFVLDNSVGQVDIIGSSDVDGIDVNLTAPGGGSVKLTRTPDDKVSPLGIPGVTGTYEWLSDRSLEVRMSRDGSSAWTGAWVASFVDPSSGSAGKKSTTSIDVTGDLIPAWTADPQHPIRVGSPAAFDVELVNAKGESVAPSALLGEATLDLSLTDASGTAVVKSPQVSKEGMGAPINLDLTSVPFGTYKLRMLLNVRTASTTDAAGQPIPGTDLMPQPIDVPLEVLPPARYPTFAQHVDFGHIEGPIAAEVDLEIVGPGCVWLTSGSTRLTANPDGVTDLAVGSKAQSRETCLKVDDGAKASLSLMLTSTKQGNGGAGGTVTVAMVPLEEGTVLQVPVTFRADIAKKLDQPSFWITLIAAMTLGPGIPVGLMYLYKYLLASKLPAQPLTITVADITISEGRVLREGQPLSFRLEDNRNFYSIARGGTRQLSIADAGLRIKTRMGASPIGQGFAVVEAPGMIGVSDTTLRPFGKDKQARLPLDLQNHWALLTTPGVADRAQLLMITGNASTPRTKVEFLSGVQYEVPRLMDELRPDTISAVGATDESGTYYTPGGEDALRPDPSPYGRQDAPSGRRVAHDSQEPSAHDEQERTVGWDPFA